MLQRLIAAVLGVLGLLAIGLGVASSTVWRGDDILVATASPDAHLVVADPGVLELAGDPVTVTVHAANDTPVVIAVGRDTDVAGWVGTDAHAQVTGLAGWHALRTEAVAAQAPTPAASTGTEPATTEPAATDPSASAMADAAAGATTAVADPSGSDLWVAQATGNGTATLTWSAQPGRWSLLVASLGEPSPVIELAWPRTVTTPWLWPGVVGGALLLLAGLGLASRLWLRARRGLTEPEWHPVLTGAMPTVAVSSPGAGAVSVDATQTVVLTRRQMREAEAAIGAATRRRSRGADAPATGAQPLLIPGAGRETPREAPAGVDDARPPVATGPAPADAPAREEGPVPADVHAAAHRDAGRGANVPRGGREPDISAAATSTPPVDDSRTRRGQPSAAPMPPHAAPPDVLSGQTSSTAALPSYFRRAAVPGAARAAAGTPVAPGGWVPGGAQGQSPSQHPAAGPGVALPTSAQDAARSDAARPDADVAGRSRRTPALRPTWSAGKPVIPDEPTDEPSGEPPSARADAWRRAWGFPGHDAGGADDAAGATDEGTHR
ncbi:hypothetical protein DDP54_12430 [Cellulomonas sp. WB94]|uniref:hypothetical protein n=1 Tax=Cellulomonas sp. WB94 TaxID=2173174 RepID=UPI000D57F8F7|nr:hypothetical protein [Cellulomonas sp. WB94]PVU83667.1 hypothetical protein DDP54_12430 [Cellulomonas sp. WB94]